MFQVQALHIFPAYTFLRDQKRESNFYALLDKCNTVISHFHNTGNPKQLPVIINFNVLLTVHLSITLVNDQLDAQFFYFITRLLQSPTCFEQRRAHHQEVKLY